MDNIQDKLTELLNNPEGMAKIRQMAEGLFGNTTDKKEEPHKDNSDFGFDIDPSALMGMMSALKTAPTDNRAQLLMALKPHLSAERQQRVDNAVKLLRLVPLIPLVKQFI